ncbi:hypothetical protein BH10PSE18_BH10PSE18_05550 [soil metagenome]
MRAATDHGHHNQGARHGPTATASIGAERHNGSNGAAATHEVRAGGDERRGTGTRRLRQAGRSARCSPCSASGCACTRGSSPTGGRGTCSTGARSRLCASVRGSALSTGRADRALSRQAGSAGSCRRDLPGSGHRGRPMAGAEQDAQGRTAGRRGRTPTVGPEHQVLDCVPFGAGPDGEEPALDHGPRRGLLQRSHGRVECGAGDAAARPARRPTEEHAANQGRGRYGTAGVHV